MPEGKGTYGSQVGRPRKKYNEGSTELNIQDEFAKLGSVSPSPELIGDPNRLGGLPNDAYIRKQSMLEDVMTSVRRRRELMALGMPEDEAEESLNTIVRNAQGFGVTRSDVLGLDAQVVQELQEAALEPLKIQKQIEALQGNTDRVPYVRGGISKLAKEASKKIKSVLGKDEAIEGTVLPHKEVVNELKRLGYSDKRVVELVDEFDTMSRVPDFDGDDLYQFIAREQSQMPDLDLGAVRRKLKTNGVDDSKIDEFFFKVWESPTGKAREYYTRILQNILDAPKIEEATLVREGLVDKIKKPQGRKPDSIISEGSREFDREFDIMRDQKRSIIKANEKARLAKETAKFREGKRLTDSDEQKLIKHYQKVNKRLFPDKEAWAWENETNPSYDPEDMARQIKQSYNEMIDGTAQFEDGFFITNAYGVDGWMSYQTVYDILGKGRTKKAEGGELDDQMSMLMEGEETHTMPDGTVMPGATHEEYEQMLPDEEMEEDYVEYVFDSTLNPQDKEYLENALAEDAKLSEIIDQVVESSTEFSGSGLLEGPGTGKSDSIPARLSDGEFVMTAKATEEIGSDKLMSMMKDAEAAADTRQKVAYGGYMTEMENETVPIQTLGVREARRNIPQVAQTRRQVEEEMLKASPRRFYQPISG